MEQTIIGLFEKFGFPALVTGILLYWVLKVQGEKLDKITEAIDCVKQALEKLLYIEERKAERNPYLPPAVKQEIANGAAPCPSAEKTGKAA